jgi:hypothetical protein
MSPVGPQHTWRCVVIGHNKIKITSEVAEFVPRPRPEVAAEFDALKACIDDLMMANDALRNLQARVKTLTSQRRSELLDNHIGVCRTLVEELVDC